MVDRRVYDNERHAHFVTFSCYRRRKLLEHDRATRIAIGRLGACLTKRDGLPAVDWPFSSARSCEQHQSIGVPIRWRPGME
jgi:hypothetical protein